MFSSPIDKPRRRRIDSSIEPQQWSSSPYSQCTPRRVQSGLSKLGAQNQKKKLVLVMLRDPWDTSEDATAGCHVTNQ